MLPVVVVEEAEDVDVVVPDVEELLTEDDVIGSSPVLGVAGLAVVAEDVVEMLDSIEATVVVVVDVSTGRIWVVVVVVVVVEVSSGA